MQYCKTYGKVRPFTALFHRQVTERTIANEDFLDFQYYNVEKKWTNDSGYTFPSLCVGYDGLYRSFQHLQKYKADPNNDSFFSENFSYEYILLYKVWVNSFEKVEVISENQRESHRIATYFSLMQESMQVKSNFHLNPSKMASVISSKTVP